MGIKVRSGGQWVEVGSSNVGAASSIPFVGVFYENNQNVTQNHTITPSRNAMSAGPITIDTGVTVTIPSGSVWVIV